MQTPDSSQSSGISRGIPILLAVVQFIFAFFGLLAFLFMAVSTAIASRYSSAAVLGWRQLLPVLLIYGGGAAFFTVMGIGTVKMKTWGRNIMLICSWTTAAAGIIALIFSMIVIPEIVNSVLFSSISLARIFAAVFILILAIVFIVIPGVFVLLYSLPKVKSSFELADPKPNWTDKVPLPLLAVTFFLWLSAAGSFVNMVSGLYFPLFGSYLPSLTARGMWLACGTGAAYFGLLCYQRKISGWVGGLLWILFMVSSTIITGRLRGYYAMGLESYGANPYVNLDLTAFDSYIFAFTLVSSVPYLGFYLFTLRYFRK